VWIENLSRFKNLKAQFIWIDNDPDHADDRFKFSSLFELQDDGSMERRTDLLYESKELSQPQKQQKCDPPRRSRRPICRLKLPEPSAQFSLVVWAWGGERTEYKDHGVVLLNGRVSEFQFIRIEENLPEEFDFVCPNTCNVHQAKRRIPESPSK